MAANPPPPEGVLSLLNKAIEGLNRVEEISSIKAARAIFGSAEVLLTTIRDSVVDEQNYVELGLFCADICQALDRGLDGRQVDELSKSMLGAIEKLTTTVTAIQKKVVKEGKRNRLSRHFHAKSDKDAIATWGRDLHGILLVFNTELSMNNHMILLDLYRNSLSGQEPADGGYRTTQISATLGELPPPSPRACFGRDDLIRDIVILAENLHPIVLIGAGGIGKTSIALAVLHHDRIRERFGDNRRFIRCDQFPASLPDLLRRLSKVIAAGIENPDDLASLRPFLSSEDMLIILDNVESIIDPKGSSAQEIYEVVEELSRFSNICLCITSRITTVPPDCKCLRVPTLSIEAAHSTFRRIYNRIERPDVIDDILRQLEFHPLSITLLATVAHQNDWDNNRLAREWDQRRTDVLHPEHNKSLAATIGLSLSSPTFRDLGPDALGLLEVVAFFPQGVSEDNLDWLFPAVTGINVVLDRFCALSLTYRSKGFITMLAPLRDHLRPKNPAQSPLLQMIKELYFARLSVVVDRFVPGFGDGQWITSEDVNVEHLLGVFTSIGVDPEVIWEACARFMNYLYWYKPRQTVLSPKIRQLSDSHPSKPRCLLWLSWLFGRVGNWAEQKQLATHALGLNRERGDDNGVAETLLSLCDVNLMLRVHKEGIEQGMEALAIQERLGNTAQQANCSNSLAPLLFEDGQFDAAEEATFRTINLAGNGQELLLCTSHHVLGRIYRSKGERENAIHHLEVALQIASDLGFNDQSFWVHYSLAQLFCGEHKFENAETHIAQAKLHATSDAYHLGRAADMHAWVWYCQRRFEDARFEVLRAIEIYEKLGVAEGLAGCVALLQCIERAAPAKP